MTRTGSLHAIPAPKPFDGDIDAAAQRMTEEEAKVSSQPKPRQDQRQENEAESESSFTSSGKKGPLHWRLTNPGARVMRIAGEQKAPVAPVAPPAQGTPIGAHRLGLSKDAYAAELAEAKAGTQSPERSRANTLRAEVERYSSRIEQEARDSGRTTTVYYDDLPDAMKARVDEVNRINESLAATSEKSNAFFEWQQALEAGHKEKYLQAKAKANKYRQRS